VAQARGSSVGVFPNAGAGAPASVLANPQPSGAPLVFLVQQTQGDWLKVLLPVRPNGSTGWIRVADVTLFQHTFRIVIEEAAHRITVYHDGAIIDQEPVGIGTRLTPTPGGLYYIKELLRPPDPNGPYGPYAYGLSGFSNVLTTFNGGDGVIGIHGTNDPAGLGHDVSHGCIRMSNAGITKLAAILPLGVPVEIRP
jgi:lipoprotein-anchoring transpeptidase ErfK/SrfK